MHKLLCHRNLANQKDVETVGTRLTDNSLENLSMANQSEKTEIIDEYSSPTKKIKSCIDNGNRCRNSNRDCSLLAELVVGPNKSTESIRENSFASAVSSAASSTVRRSKRLNSSHVQDVLANNFTVQCSFSADKRSQCADCGKYFANINSETQNMFKKISRESN
jgi:hypothetical protein